MPDMHAKDQLAEKAKGTSIPGYLGLSREDWGSFLESQSVPKFRSNQVADWVFKHFTKSTAEMTNVSKDLRAILDSQFDWTLPEIVSALDSKDGSTKL